MPAPEGFAARVQRWQLSHGRHGLPWQGTRDPYRVWLSEVMLQQTQVGTVLGYYARFLERFPTVRHLAEAELDEVLASWSGLGYYSRARALHRAARQVLHEHGGEFPASAEALQSLPGVGRSTAAAIAAFCFGQRVAILDGNVKRVLARASAFDGDLARAPEARRLWSLAESLLPASGIESYTQGLMDLGATVCLAREPRCDTCPVRDACAARAQGRPEAYPVKSRRTQRRALRTTWAWLESGPRVWLVRRPAQGVWAGLWSLPEFDSPDAAREALAALRVEPAELPGFVHVLTHRDWTLTPLRWTLPARPSAATRQMLQARWPEGRWIARDDALGMGLPAPVRRLLGGQEPARQKSAPAPGRPEPLG